jgi:hypothetical protein
MDRKPVPLLDMPAEIREMIWKYALGNRQLQLEGSLPSVKDVTPRPLPNEITFISEEDASVPSDSINPSLLRVNRQIHNEAEPVLYGTNLFSFYGNRTLQTWLASLTDRQKSFVKAIGFRFDFCIWNTAFVALPSTIESVHLTGFTYGWGSLSGPEIAQLSIVQDLNKTMQMVVQNGLKIKNISVAMGVLGKSKKREEEDKEKQKAVKRSLAYCRDKALKCLQPNPTNHAASGTNL